MFSANRVCKNVYFLFIQARYKTKTHWSKLKKKTGPTTKALNHFDEFYGSVFGKQWEPMREAMLRRSKYVAVVNNYGDTEDTIEFLRNRGGHCLNELMTVQNSFHKAYSPAQEPLRTENTDRLAEYTSRLQADEISSIYRQADSQPERLDTADITLHIHRQQESKKEKILPQKMQTLDQSLAEAEIDQSRIIDPSYGISSEALYQYVPATKLKGMDEWVPESLHYSYYSKAKDFPLVVEPETVFQYPEHLKVITYEMNSEWTLFPEPKRCQTGVFNYYPMDCGSILTVLALCLAPGDRVLDLCAAPGGKSLVALQSLLPSSLVCNDVSLSRRNRIERVFRDYLIDFGTSGRWRERVQLAQLDGRAFVDDQGFDKVLVDVPCTTDRHSVNEDENNIFRPDRVKERLKLPEIQSALLTNALKLVKVGGAVVYSTCSLSPIQNDGVVHMALKNAFENHGIIATVKDLTVPMSGFTSTVKLGAGEAAPKYGQLVVPDSAANFGPTYFARLVRVK